MFDGPLWLHSVIGARVCETKKRQIGKQSYRGSAQYALRKLQYGLFRLCCFRFVFGLFLDYCRDPLANRFNLREAIQIGAPLDRTVVALSIYTRRFSLPRTFACIISGFQRADRSCGGPSVFAQPDHESCGFTAGMGFIIPPPDLHISISQETVAGGLPVGLCRYHGHTGGITLEPDGAC